MDIERLERDVAVLAERTPFGRISAVVGVLVEVEGLANKVAIGDHLRLKGRDGRATGGEVVGVRGGRALLMPFGGVSGLALGDRADVLRTGPVLHPHESWQGRTLNAFGAPADGKGALPQGSLPCPLRASPPAAHARSRMGGKMDLGVRALNAFLTCCRGQRMGIFSGSGIGKSTLLSMIARYADADVIVIGLIGERGRELREFLEDDLGPDGRGRSVVVVATSDEPAPVRRMAAYTTLAVAEYFRARGRHVLCLMDSVTRFAMALREIGLAAGEPPATKGYTPSVFAELPKLLERAGPGVEGEGSITGLFTVLVEGDDHNEPVADAVRGILDGHIVLTRAIAERGRYPAIDILKSLSRSMPACNSAEETALVTRARRLLATYEDMSELIRLGAYRRGSDSAVDEAIRLNEGLQAFLCQAKGERTSLADSYSRLREALAEGNGDAA